MLMVRLRGVTPPPSYGQPDRKKPVLVFDDFPNRILLDLSLQIGVLLFKDTSFKISCYRTQFSSVGIAGIACGWSGIGRLLCDL